MAIQTKWNVNRIKYQKKKITSNFLEVKERAKIFVWYNPDTQQADLPFLTPDVYKYLESDGKNEMVEYSTYELTETDPRALTMKFTTTKHFDGTKGRWRVLLLHPNHMDFYGFILDEDYDVDTDLYTYQCQDGGRAYIGKGRHIYNSISKYNIVKMNLLRGHSETSSRGHAEYALSGLRKIEEYQQPEYNQYMKACNPMESTVSHLLSYDSYIDVIRGVCFGDGSRINVYFDKYGVCQIEPGWSPEKIKNTPTLFFSLKDMNSNTYSMDKTNVISAIQVKRDKLNVSEYYNGTTMFDIPLSFYFGYNMGVLDSVDTTGLPTVQSASTEDSNTANTSTNISTGTTNDIITVNMMPSCGCHGKVAYKKYTKSYKNYCPMCKRTGTLTNNPKRVYEGEITCGNTGPACKDYGGAGKKIKGCDADYCGYCGTEKNGTCRSKLTPATATATNTSTSAGTSTDTTTTTSTTASTSTVDYTSEAYLDREKQEALNKMQESYANMFEYKMKVPLNSPIFKDLHVGKGITAELPKGWSLENIEKWDNLFYSQSTFWNVYVLEDYTIRGLKITGDKNGTWADITLSPFRSSRSSYTSWLRKAEQAYASATTAQSTTTTSGSSSGGGSSTSTGLGQPLLGNDCTSTNSMRGMSGGGYGNSGHGKNFDAAAQKGYAVQGANYYNWARQYKDIKSLCRALAKRFSYVYYTNNRTCPQKVHNNGGTIACNCYDACRYVKVCCDACGFPCTIITGYIWGYGHGWNAVKYNGTWYSFDLCFSSKGTSTNATNSFRAVW